MGEAEVVPPFKKRRAGFAFHYNRENAGHLCCARVNVEHDKGRNTYRVIVIGSH